MKLEVFLFILLNFFCNFFNKTLIRLIKLSFKLFYLDSKKYFVSQVRKLKMTILQKISYKQKKLLEKITEDNLYLKKAGLIKKNDLKK